LICAASRLEHDRVFVDAIERCRVNAVFPTPCSPTRRTERGGLCSSAGDDDLHELSPTPCEECGRIVERSLPDPPDVPDVRSRPPCLETPPEVRPKIALEAVDERLEVVSRLERDLVERVDSDLLAGSMTGCRE